MQPELVSQRLEEFRTLCKERGIPITHQRLAVYQTLLETSEHPSAETLFKTLHPRLPQLSLGTVYKNLEILHELGLISEVNSLHESARYDTNLKPHHHLVCTHCKKVIDIYDDALSLAKPTQTHGFTVSHIQVQVNGVCPKCQPSATQNS
jgi:Fur family transcriptional regulator, peroxide stress response regulator